MRIISKFQDVYDMQHSMFDPDKVWNRKSETLLIKDTFDEVLVPVLNTNRYRVYAVPYFFTGEVHFLYEYEDPNVGSFNTFNLDKLEEILTKLNVTTVSYFSTFFHEDLAKGLQKFATKLEEIKVIAKSAFEELRVPLATITKWEKVVPDDKSTQKIDCYTVVTNPRLMDSIPWSEVEPNLYRLHQSIEQYIWGVIGTGEPDLISTSDKDRLEAHGFNSVTSFRNMAR